MQADRQRTIAETLTWLAETWPGDWGDSLLVMAADVRRDLTERVCCPLCQEIRCDDDCPLREERA